MNWFPCSLHTILWHTRLTANKPTTLSMLCRNLCREKLDPRHYVSTIHEQQLRRKFPRSFVFTSHLFLILIAQIHNSFALCSLKSIDPFLWKISSGKFLSPSALPPHHQHIKLSTSSLQSSASTPTQPAPKNLISRSKTAYIHPSPLYIISTSLYQRTVPARPVLCNLPSQYRFRLKHAATTLHPPTLSVS